MGLSYSSLTENNNEKVEVMNNIKTNNELIFLLYKNLYSKYWIDQSSMWESLQITYDMYKSNPEEYSDYLTEYMKDISQSFDILDLEMLKSDLKEYYTSLTNDLKDDTGYSSISGSKILLNLAQKISKDYDLDLTNIIGRLIDLSIKHAHIKYLINHTINNKSMDVNIGLIEKNSVEINKILNEIHNILYKKN